MPITAIAQLLDYWDMACSLSSLPRASFYHWRGGSTAGPSHSSGHHGSPLDASFSLDDDCTLVAELEATSSRRSQVVKDRSSVKDLLGPVGADSYRQDRRSGAGRYQKEGLEGQA